MQLCILTEKRLKILYHGGSQLLLQHVSLPRQQLSRFRELCVRPLPCFTRRAMLPSFLTRSKKRSLTGEHDSSQMLQTNQGLFSAFGSVREAMGCCIPQRYIHFPYVIHVNYMYGR